MSVMVTKRKLVLTDSDLEQYERFCRSVKTAHEFSGEEFKEREWLAQTIESMNKRAKDLLSSYSKNCSIMNHREVTAWTIAFNEASHSVALHRAVMEHKFPY